MNSKGPVWLQTLAQRLVGEVVFTGKAYTSQCQSETLPTLSLTNVSNFIVHNHPPCYIMNVSHFTLWVAIVDLTSKDNITSQALHKIFKLQRTLVEAGNKCFSPATLNIMYLKYFTFKNLSLEFQNQIKKINDNILYFLQFFANVLCVDVRLRSVVSRGIGQK